MKGWPWYRAREMFLVLGGVLGHDLGVSISARVLELNAAQGQRRDARDGALFPVPEEDWLAPCRTFGLKVVGQSEKPHGDHLLALPRHLAQRGHPRNRFHCENVALVKVVMDVAVHVVADRVGLGNRVRYVTVQPIFSRQTAVARLEPRPADVLLVEAVRGKQARVVHDQHLLHGRVALLLVTQHDALLRGRVAPSHPPREEDCLGVGSVLPRER
jgi:hypothetical protein